MMARTTLFLVSIICGINYAFADILVQPGYGQPHAIVQPHATFPATLQTHQNPIHHFRESSPTNAYATPQFPGQLGPQELGSYYLEVQPVYTDPKTGQNHMVGYPLLHYPHLPLLPQRPFPPRHLHLSKLGGHSYTGPSLFLRQPQYPLVANDRIRRSTNGGSDLGAKGAIKDDVAPKPSLNEESVPVVDLQNQAEGDPENLEEKHLETRESKSDHEIIGAQLLDSNPSGMYSGHHQYRTMDNMEHSDDSKMMTALAQQHQERTAAKTQEPPRRYDIAPQINSKDLHHALMLQATAPKEQFTSKSGMPEEMGRSNAMEFMTPDASKWGIMAPKESALNSPYLGSQPLRNFPDPRPPQPNNKKHPHQTEFRTADAQTSQISAPHEETKDASMSRNEFVGTIKKLKKLHALKHQQQYTPIAVPFAPTYSYYDFSPYQGCNCPCTTTPNYVIVKNNAGNLVDLGSMQTSVPSVAQLHQVPSIQGTTYAPPTKYVVLPQGYNNHGSNYGSGYTTVSTYGGSSPLKYYVQSSGVPTIMRQ